MRIFKYILLLLWEIIVNIGAQQLISVFPIGAHATGGTKITITGENFEMDLLYSCNFSFINDVQFVMKSSIATVLSNTKLECLVPQWDFFGTTVELWLSNNDIEVGKGQERLEFQLWESWLEANPIVGKSTGGEPVKIMGAGFDLNAFYQCVWSTGGEENLASINSIPSDFNTISCTTPDWSSLFSSELRNIELYLYRIKDDGTEPFIVPFLGPQFFFSFSSGSSPWSSLFVLTSDLNYPAGHGVEGGDTIEYVGDAFDFPNASLYSCNLKINTINIAIVPKMVSAVYIQCLIPEIPTFEGTAVLSLQYNSATPALIVEPTPDAKLALFDTVSDSQNPVIEILAIWTSVVVSGGVLPFDGGSTALITGLGFDPRRQYLCVWTGETENVLFTTAHVQSAGKSVICLTPSISTNDDKNFQFSIVRKDSLLPLIDLSGVNNVFSVGQSWVSKDISEGLVYGNELVTITGIGLSGTYQCIFGLESTNATVVSDTTLTCLTPMNYGSRYSAGKVDFEVAVDDNIADILPFGGNSESDAEMFTFYESWTSANPTTAIAYSMSVSSIIIEGEGFDDNIGYFCAFAIPSCINSILSNSSTFDEIEISHWNRPVYISCFVVSIRAFVLSKIAIQCSVPEWSYPSGETILTVFEENVEGELFEIGMFEESLENSKFYFSGVGISAFPKESDIYGGNSIEISAIGLDINLSDYVIKWSTLENNQAVYSEVLSSTPSPCNHDVQFEGISDVLCVNTVMPIWPYSSGDSIVSIFRTSDQHEFASIPFSIKLESPTHYQVVASFLIEEVLAKDISFTAIFELRYWLAEITQFQVSACQVSEISDVSNGRKELAERSVASVTTSITVVLATSISDEYSDGIEGARIAAESAIQSLMEVNPPKTLASLGNVNVRLNGNPTAVVISSECPAGMGKVENVSENSTDADALVCSTCKAGTFTADSKTCEPCPFGSTCDTYVVGVPSVAKGFWRNPTAMSEGITDFESFPYHQCLIEEACLGGMDSSCAPGNTPGSNLCVKCNEGTYSDSQGGLCSTCTSNSSIIVKFTVLISVLILLGSITFFWYVYTKHLSIAEMVIEAPELYSLTKSKPFEEKKSNVDLPNIVNERNSRSVAPIFSIGDGNNRPVTVSNLQNVSSSIPSRNLSKISERALSSESARSQRSVAIRRDTVSESNENTIERVFQSSNDTTVPLKLSEEINKLKPCSPLSGTLLMSKLQYRCNVKGVLLVAISHLQMLSALRFGATYWLRWPYYFSALLSALKIIDVDVLSIPSLSIFCLRPEFNFYTEWLIAVLFLPGISVIVFFVRYIGTAILENRVTNNEITRTLQIMIFRGKCMQSLLWVVVAVYPGVTRRIFQLYHCRTLDEDRSYLWSDLSIQCSGSEYNVYVGANVVAFLAYLVILPVLLIWRMYQSRIYTSDDHLKLSLNLSFLFVPYKLNLWWWEISDLFRRIFMTGILIYVRPHSSEQFGIGFALCIVTLIVHAIVRPFTSSVTNVLHSVGLVFFAFTLFCGLILFEDNKNDSSRNFNLMGLFCLTINLIFLVSIIPTLLFMFVTRHSEGNTTFRESLYQRSNSDRIRLEQIKTVPPPSPTWKWEPTSIEVLPSDSVSNPISTLHSRNASQNVESGSCHTFSPQPRGYLSANDLEAHALASVVSRRSDQTSSDGSNQVQMSLWTYPAQQPPVGANPMVMNRRTTVRIPQVYRSDTVPPSVVDSDPSEDDDDDHPELPPYAFILPEFQTTQTAATDTDSYLFSKII